MTTEKPYRLWLTNHNYYVETTFATVEAAILEARRIHFDCSVHRMRANGSASLVAAWSVFGGERRYVRAEVL